MKGFKGKKISDIVGRKIVMIWLILTIILLIITTIYLIKEAMKEKEQKHIVYTENGHVDYNVYLKENEFYDKEYLGKDRQYIASLINYVEANLRYDLQASEPNLKHKYTYRIVADINVEEESNKNSIYKFSEELVKSQTIEFNTNKKLQINERVQIDYNKYNDIIKRFIDVYNLSNIESTLKVNMYVSVDGVSKSKAPVSSLTIPLTTKTVAIDIQSNSVNATEISVYKNIANNNKLYISVLTAILTVMVIIELFIFNNNTKDETAIYQAKVKKILLNYDSYIQKINNNFDFNGYQQLEMKSFDDLLQIRDTIGQPILMSEKGSDKETDFFKNIKKNFLYIYKLKLKDINKKDNKKS